MKRSELREHLFLMLFRRNFYPPEELLEQGELYLEDAFTYPQEDEGGAMVSASITDKDSAFLKDRYAKALDKLEEIDAMIEAVSEGWKLVRMGKVELSLIRLAVFEMKFDEEIPTGVAINEAVELSKKFGEENSYGFVNGILAKLAE